MTPICFVDPSRVIEYANYKQFVGCLILTYDRKILLQQRGHDWTSHPGMLATFGGLIESGETPIQALVRELKEELGAAVVEADLVPFGAITESITGYTELVHTFFWHDKKNTINSCAEGEEKYYDSVADALIHPKVMDDVRWLLNECARRKLIP